MEPKCCSVSVGVRGCVARAIPAKPAQCLPCSRSQTSVQRLLKTKKTGQSSTGGIPRGEAVNVFSGKSLRKATVVPSAKCDGVRLARRHGETRSSDSQLGARFGIHSNRPRCGSTMARVRYEYVQAVQLQSTCSEEYTDEHPRATSARTGFRKGLHQIELLCRAEGRQSSRNSYSHAAYPRQRASGTCMKQPSRLGIGSCTAESWYVCFPYRHLSWFAVRRSSICLLLCAACAPPCQSALSPWRICKRFAQARPHSDSRMDFFVTL